MYFTKICELDTQNRIEVKVMSLGEANLLIEMVGL